MLKLLTLLLLSAGATALQAPVCCNSRMSVSRIAPRAALCMCDGEAAAVVAETVPEVAAVPEAVAMPEAVAVEDAAAPVEAAAPQNRAAKGNKIALEDLVVDSEVEGKVRSVMAYGAFVDIGASTDGLLHVSEISNEFVQDANEKLTAGDTVTCRIKSINLEKGQLALSCKEKTAAPQRGPRKEKADMSVYENFDKMAFVTGKVNSITDYGAFVTLQDGVDGLLHISSIKEGGIGKVSDELTVGQEIQVRVVQYEKSKRRIGLSMKPFSEDEDKPRGAGGRGGQRGGRGGDSAFGDEADFKLNDEELEALTEEDEGEFTSSIESAFARAAYLTEAKASKQKWTAQIL